MKRKKKIKTSEIVMVRDMTSNWGIIQWIYYFFLGKKIYPGATSNDQFVKDTLARREEKK